MHSAVPVTGVCGRFLWSWL